MKTGKVSGNILKRSVLGQIRTRREEVLKGAGTGEDCAFLKSAGEGIASCMQEAPVAVSAEAAMQVQAFPLFTMGQLIRKCTNNLAAAGADPLAVMITLLLPAGEEESALKALMAEAEAACSVLSLEIIGGQTRITRTVHCPVAVVTGYGGQGSGLCRAGTAGADVVLSKWIGLEGTAFLAKRNREKLLSRYPAYLVDEASGFDRYLSVLPEAGTALESGVYAMHDASEGGIFGALWELGEMLGMGLTIDLRKIPLRQETVEVCECCDVNPYELLSGGCLVMVSADGSGLKAALEERGIPAAVIGKVTKGNDRLLLNGEEIRYMDRPKADELYRYFEEKFQEVS